MARQNGRLSRRDSRLSFLRRASRVIKRRFRARKIILFGSCAWGKPGPDSDLDLLVVMDTKMRPHRQAALIRLVLDEELGVQAPMDIIVRSAQAVRRSLKDNDLFIKAVMERGLAL